MVRKWLGLGLAVPLLLLRLLMLSGAEHAERLQQEIEELQAVLPVAEDPVLLYEVHLALATRWQTLNNLSPDGGSRVPAADHAFRKAYELAQAQGDANRVATVCTNWGALLLDSGRIDSALEVLDDGLRWSSQLAHGTRLLSSLMFNKAKALAIAGRQQEAQQQYQDTAYSAFGQDLAAFAKAMAATASCPYHLLVQVLATLKHLGHDVMQSGHVPDTPLHIRACTPWLLWPGFQDHKCPAHTACYSASLVPHTETAAQALAQLNNAWLDKPALDEVSWLCFAAHKGLMGLQLLDMSWAALQLGNQLMAQQHPYSPHQDWQHLNILKEVFTESFPFPAAQSSRDSSSTPAPILIVGLPRSGSTLLESLLATHTDVVAAGEDTAFAPLSPRVGVLVDEAYSRRDVHLTSIRAQLEEVGREYTARMCRQFVPPGRSCEAVHVVDKMLRNLWLLGHVRLVLPHSCVIHVVRHPLDAGVSCYQQPFHSASMSWSWDLEHIAEQIKLTWTISQHWNKVLPGWVHTVFYEELVTRPEPTLRRVLSACGLSWQDHLLTSFHTQHRTVSTASMDQVRQPLFRSSVGSWRRFEAQLKPLRRAVGEPLIQAYEALLAARLKD